MLGVIIVKVPPSRAPHSKCTYAELIVVLAPILIRTHRSIVSSNWTCYPVRASSLRPLSSCVYRLFKFNYVRGQYSWLLPLPLTLPITAALSRLHTSLLGSISDDLIVSCVRLTRHSSFVSYRYSPPNHKSQPSGCMQVEA